MRVYFVPSSWAEPLYLYQLFVLCRRVNLWFWNDSETKWHLAKKSIVTVCVPRSGTLALSGTQTIRPSVSSDAFASTDDRLE